MNFNYKNNPNIIVYKFYNFFNNSIRIRILLPNCCHVMYSEDLIKVKTYSVDVSIDFTVIMFSRVFFCFTVVGKAVKSSPV